jgi:hypothetical protein
VKPPVIDRRVRARTLSGRASPCNRPEALDRFEHDHRFLRELSRGYRFPGSKPVAKGNDEVASPRYRKAPAK